MHRRRVALFLAFGVALSSSGTQVCLPYAQNTGPNLIALAWDGLDPSSTILDCVVTGAVGYRVSYALAGEVPITVDTGGASTQTVTLSGLRSSSTYSISVTGLDSVGDLIAASTSATVAIETDAAVTGEIASFGFVSTQQCVLQQLTFYEDGFPFVLEASSDGADLPRLVLSAGGSAAPPSPVAFVTAGGSAHFEGGLDASSLVVGGALLNVSSAAGTFTVGSGMLAVDSGSEVVSFGAKASVLTSTGALTAAGASFANLDVGLSFDVDGALGAVTAQSIEVGAIALHAVPSDITLAAAANSAALVVSSSGTPLHSFRVLFNASADSAGTDMPALNVLSNTLAVGSIVPSNAANALTLERVQSITSTSSLRISNSENASQFITLLPAQRAITDLRAIQFDATATQTLTLGGITLSATGASDGQLLVGDGGDVLFASSELRTVSVGDHILADSVSGDFSAAHVFSNSTVQAARRLAVSHANDTLDSSTFMEHELVRVSADTELAPGALTVQQGSAAARLCAGSGSCTTPTLASSSGVLDIALAFNSSAPAARFESGQTTLFGDVLATGALVAPVVRAAGASLSVSVGSAADNSSSLTFDVGGTLGAATLTASALTVGVAARFNGPVGMAQRLSVEGDAELLGKLSVEGSVLLRPNSSLITSNLASHSARPLSLEANDHTGVKVRVMGSEVVVVTSSAVSVNGSLQVGDGIASPSVRAQASDLVLGTDASSVDFHIGNETVGTVSAAGITVDAGRNFVAPQGSAVVFGDMPVYANSDGTGNWRNATPVLMLDGATDGVGSLTVSGDLQTDGGMLVRGNAWLGSDLVLSDPGSGSHPPAPLNSTDLCTKGTLRWDTGFIYICVEENSWKRVALEAF